MHSIAAIALQATRISIVDLGPAANGSRQGADLRFFLGREDGRVEEIAIWVFPKIGVFPPKWMVKIMENPVKLDDLGGTTIFGNIHI